MGIGRLLGAAPGAQFEQDGRSSPALTLDTAALNVRVRAGPIYNEAMPARVITFLLAFVLLWSGLSTFEAPRVLASPSPEQAFAIAHAGGHSAAHEGSIEHHHLDDLPSQAQSDPPAETPGLLPAPLAPSAQRMVMAQPHPFASAEAVPPFLAGPLRPPRSAALAS